MKIVFVFGSNLAGRHGAGSALFARRYQGAVTGKGEGPQGNSYAIPTKDEHLNPLSLSQVKMHVDRFIEYAKANPATTFNIVAIGCGLAGYTPEQIGPMFKDAPTNCNLPSVFRRQ